MWAGVVGVVDGSPAGGGGDWIGTPVPIIGGTSARMNPAGAGLPDDGGGSLQAKVAKQALADHWLKVLHELVEGLVVDSLSG